MKVAIQRNGRQRGKSVPLKAVSILRLCAMLLLTPRNYAGCQIERCAHQSRDERNLLERILIFILISMMLVGDIPLSLRVFCKKRGSACRRSEFIFLSHAGGRRFFGRMGAWRLRRNSDQQGGYHPPTEQHALTRR